MGELIILGDSSPLSETPLEFVRRNGPTLTHEIQYRFGLRHAKDAYELMVKLRRKKLVTSKRVTHEFGASLEWKVIDA